MNAKKTKKKERIKNLETCANGMSNTISES